MKLFELKNLQRRNRFRNEAQIRQLCANAFLGNDRLICRVLGRYKMFVDAQDVGFSSHLLLDGYWEMWVTEVMADLVCPGMRVVDIGANLGYFTVLLADLVGAEGRVYAFEPNGRLIDLLRQSVTVNGFAARVFPYQQALGDTEEEFRLIVPHQEPKNGYLMRSAGEEGERVETRRLDDYPEILDADFIKIDADMSEWRIWRGMSGVFDRERPLTIMLEFAAIRYSDPSLFLDEMLQRRFSLHVIDIVSGVREISKAEILASAPDQDIMLLLTR